MPITGLSFLLFALAAVVLILSVPEEAAAICPSGGEYPVLSDLRCSDGRLSRRDDPAYLSFRPVAGPACSVSARCRDQGGA